ncbi:acyl-CoA thioesterase/bile acid-CoA:amino acid N-acyltransferase family protein [Streptomyces sp. DSM 42041]|uniref:Acyl-CoA thioesterase/bile acid-CoA:amino acid N-acyltransferase family protein n=1 Tax=Streptomyces hazeniae TaxID=3075538 RepID=A0ABU2NU18_9ACTN|nr:acyl-CoA thioesterase/bile acid-CoA:amino acid N-acyltransferase family protein [Streptomyces sp. DSM 42041]MDT0380474.1 acyl-CoA thioesterase/bile acid-CoA:amino acid N-acyltransferase family protein [Streptomyces sp. DSM 42041]
MAQRGTFRADGGGVVDLTEDQPLDGSYEKADGMGLFWSMKPGKKGVRWFAPPGSSDRPAYDVRLVVKAEGKPSARRTVTRVGMGKGVRHRRLRVEKDDLHGELYLPPPGAQAAAPVLLFGGSEGGDTQWSRAALLASRGHPALSLCYFRCPGRPGHLEGIELEYFARAAEFLLGQEGVEDRKLVVAGSSRGSEAAQLLAQHRPGLVEDAVAFASSNHVAPALPDAGADAWTRDGEPVPQDWIPLDDVRGTVLGVAGGDDRLWDATYLSEPLAKRHRLLTYEKAGHFVSGPPYLPEAKAGWRYGGTRAANAAAKADAWPEVLKLVRE